MLKCSRRHIESLLLYLKKLVCTLDVLINNTQASLVSSHQKKKKYSNWLVLKGSSRELLLYWLALSQVCPPSPVYAVKQLHLEDK